MEEDRNGNKCLICSCSISIITTTLNDHSTTRERSEGYNSFSSSSVDSSTTKHQFHQRLYVIFILRNILELPVHQLASHLSNNWDIQDWISVCDGCDALVVQCRGIYDQLVKISKKFKLCQQSIIKIVKENSDRGVSAGKSKLKAVNYSEQDKKSNYRFVEEIHNFVLKRDYEHLIDPLKKTRPWALSNKVKTEVTQQKQETLVTDSVIKTEPFEELNDWTPDDNCNNENSMEMQSFSDEDASESEEDDLKNDYEHLIDPLEETRPSEIIKQNEKDLATDLAIKTEPDEEFNNGPLYRMEVQSFEDEDAHEFEEDEWLPDHSDQDDNYESEENEPSCSGSVVQDKFNENCSKPKKQREKPTETGERRPLIEKEKSSKKNADKTESNSLSCHVCQKAFNMKFNLRRHLSNIHKIGAPIEEERMCPVEGCGKVYRYLSTYNDHMATHEKKTFYPCTFCEKVFYVLATLKTHERRVHNESAKKFKCEQCPFKTAYISNFNLHKKRHNRPHHTNNDNLMEVQSFEDEDARECEEDEWLPNQDDNYESEENQPNCGGSEDKDKFNENCSKPKPKREKPTRTGERRPLIVKEKRRKRYVCRVCQKAFTIKFNLQRHLSNIHKIGAPIEEERTCPVEGCGKVYRYLSTYNDHMATHEMKTFYPCTFCKKVFYVQATLKTHERRVHSESAKKFQCEQCPFKTAYISNFNLHKKKHNPPQHTNNDSGSIAGIKTETDGINETVKQFICQVCGKRLKSMTKLKWHQKNSLHCKQLHMSIEEATVICHLCGGRFCNKKYLEKHIRERHERIHKFTCEHCNKGFPGATTYKEHLASVHQTGEYYDNKEQFKCPVEGCGKIIFYSTVRKRHIEHHEELKGEPQYKCEQCGRAFFADRNCRQHVRSVHQGHKYKKKPKKSNHPKVLNDGPPFKCEQCGKVFNLNRYRTQHLRTVHQVYQLKKRPKMSSQKKVVGRSNPPKSTESF